MVLGVILAIYRARKQGLKDDLIFDFILLALPIAIVCARGYYVVFEWNSYSGDNIYRLLLAFDEAYHSATEAEQKEFMKAFIERIEMFPEKRKDGSWIRKNI